MLTWVIYDIQKNKIRNKIAKMCKVIGLYRVQKSVFLGDLDHNSLDTLALKSKEIIDLENDAVYIFPLCKEDFKKVITLGKAFDRKLVSDEILSKFF